MIQIEIIHRERPNRFNIYDTDIDKVRDVDL
jgi:hypothetical protein